MSTTSESAGASPADTQRRATLTGATHTEDDWDTMKADIKALRSVSPQPEPAKSMDDKRTVYIGPGDWVGEIRPTPPKVKSLVEILLSIFVRDHNGNAILRGSPIEQTNLPGFVGELTLRLSLGPWILCEVKPGTPPWRVSPANLPPQSKDQLREHISSLFGPEVHEGNYRVSDWIGPPVTEATATWRWMVPPGGEFQFYTVLGDDSRVEWREAPYMVRDLGLGYQTNQQRIVVWEGYDEDEWPDIARGYGGLCLLKVPIKDSILELRWIEFILAQTSFGNYANSYRPTLSYQPSLPDSDYPRYLSSIICFLGTFAGKWPSRNERSEFSHKADMRSEGFNRYYLQVHFRCFTCTPKSLKSSPGTGGLHCSRQRGEIVSDTLKVIPHFFEERRISIFGILSTSDCSSNVPAFYRVLVLAEAGMDFPFQQVKASGLNRRAGLEGTIAFHAAIFATVGVWETEWNNVLDAVDGCLQLRLEEDLQPGVIGRWMFDDDFELSSLYFSILQFLRIFGECIRTVGADLRRLGDLFLKSPEHFPIQHMTPDELQVMRSNWESVMEVQERATKRLMARLSEKTEEVKSLRDGLFNASALREANRSTTMNRYVIIFTIVTVLYLPPSFMSTVFDMKIFQKRDQAETTWEYEVMTVSVSLITYVVAALSIIAVNWGHVKRCSLKWWHQGYPASDYGASEGSVGSASDTQASQTEKRRFSWFGRNSSRRQAGLGAQDQDPPA